MFRENSPSAKKLHLLYDRDNEHYNVITNLNVGMAKRYICNGCDTLYDKTHKYDKVCSLCTATPACTKAQTKHCSTCNRRFLKWETFSELFNSQSERQASLLVETICRNCSYLVTGDSKHECFKKFCNICNKKQPSGHFCYVAPLKPSKFSDNFVTFSSIRNAHKSLRNVMGLLNIYRTSYVLNKCVPSVKPWKIWVSILNSVGSVPIRSGKIP